MRGSTGGWPASAGDRVRPEAGSVSGAHAGIFPAGRRKRPSLRA